ncbi:class II aldolase/adducin family protein [Alloalcanivorax sp. C16-2]|uniref:class II aldolase/adducin family protein n=1 Tax=Alloalcanivorax TaxID=3020832 RepID=UPI00193384C2|nr:class II aldolase/adducin family protein [Alloalcanivorax marinus]MBL7249368.1 class II aldolase/adducin family protein [Alloalcanivorax marinus]
MTSLIDTPLADHQITVRKAARALGRHGLAHAYGHCSQRLDDNHFLVCAARPLGTIAPGEEGRVVALDEPLPEGVLGEVRIHREIYRRRPDVGGVVRGMPPRAMSLSVLGRTPRLLHGMGAYFVDGIPLWDDPQLIRDDSDAERLAGQLGGAAAIVMRGNGVVTAGPSLPDAVVLGWYLEDAARIEIDCLPAADAVRPLGEQEARRRATRSGRIFERMWDYLTHGDPE